MMLSLPNTWTPPFCDSLNGMLCPMLLHTINPGQRAVLIFPTYLYSCRIHDVSSAPTAVAS